MQDYTKIVVAGDVDSGKSTLIGRFLYESGSLAEGVVDDIAQVCQNLKHDFEFAYLLDSFEEERERELTIDTTQCFCKRKKGKYVIFIDVPGHRELLRNMLCGSSYADMAILVVDVDKSVKNQTKRHAFILKFLGITRIVVVINKMDALNFDEKVFLQAKEEIGEVFKQLGIRNDECIPISGKKGDNLFQRSKAMPWYKGRMLDFTLDKNVIRKKSDDLRFLVQDIYEMGKERVAAGVIICGSIRKGDRVVILPIQEMTQVKAIKYFNRNITAATAPAGVGLVLGQQNSLARGQVISKLPRKPISTKTITCKIFCVRSLDKETEFKFRCAVQETSATIERIDRVWDIVNLAAKDGPPKENDVVEVILRMASDVVVEKYVGNNSLGRFVLINNREKITAIGTIL
ncbi:MAG: GTP-binding protein [Candidatus Omnitrophota bacterium]